MRRTTGMTGRIGQGPETGRVRPHRTPGILTRVLLALVAGVGMGGARSPAHATPAAIPSIIGEWETKDHDGVFRVMQCGTEICGDLVGLSYTKDVPKDHNGHSECGLRMLTGFTPDQGAAGHWNGHILDPDSGHVYHAKIWIAPSGALKLRGFVGVPLFGETETWTPFTGKIGPECRLP